MKALGIALGVVGITGAIVLGGPWYTGTQLKKSVVAKVAEVNGQFQANSLPDVSLYLALESLETGWFSSQARYLLRITPLQGAAWEIHLEDHIEHGPFPLSRLQAGQLMPVQETSHFELMRTPATEWWFKGTDGKTPLHGDGVVGYGGSLWSHVTLEPFQFSSLERGQHFESTGGHLAVEAGFGGAPIKLEARLGNLVLVHAAHGKAVRVQIDGLSMDGNWRHHPDAQALYLGTSEVAIRDIELHFSQLLQPISIEDILFTGETREEGANGRVSHQARQVIGAVRYGEQNLGALYLGVTLGNLDAQVLQAFSERFDEYSKALSGNKVTQISQLQSQLKESALTLLETQPNFTLDELSLRTAQGKGQLSLSLELGRPTNWQAAPMDIASELIQRLQMHLVVDKGLIRDLVSLPAAIDSVQSPEGDEVADRLAHQAVALQLATLEGDVLQTHVDFQHGMIDFNGQSLTLEQFMQEIQKVRRLASPRYP